MTYIDSSDLIKNPQLDDDRLHLSEKPENKTDAYGVREDDNYLYAASASDMTGLARTVAHNEYEAQSYEEIYPYLPPVPPLPSNSAISVADTPISEGIHAEYRKQVTPQSSKDDL